MSNHNPRTVQTSTEVSPLLAITVIVSLALTAVALFALSINLLQRGDTSGDLLYTIGGVIVMLLVTIPLAFLFDITVSAFRSIARRK